MAYALILKRVKSGSTSWRPDYRITVLAVIPCCGYQLKRARHHYSAYWDRWVGEVTTYYYGGAGKAEYARKESEVRCSKCHRWLQTHILIDIDETFKPCGHKLTSQYSSFDCEFRKAPGMLYCNIHNKWEREHK